MKTKQRDVSLFYCRLMFLTFNGNIMAISFIFTNAIMENSHQRVIALLLTIIAISRMAYMEQLHDIEKRINDVCVCVCFFFFFFFGI